jgi:hypothetical protein
MILLNVVVFDNGLYASINMSQHNGIDYIKKSQQQQQPQQQQQQQP